MDYFEVFYLHHHGKDEEIYSLNGKFPFPLISNRENVTINGERYMVFKREQVRSNSEVTVNYYLVAE